MCLIHLKNITKNYPFGKDHVCALQNIELRIQSGEFISIVGNSGSGKTTLMNILGCLDMPDGGSYFYRGEDICHFSPKKLSRFRNETLGFVFQSFHLIPTLTALENVELPLSYRGIKKSHRSVLAKAMLARVGLEKRIHHFPRQLSGGQQQRTAIARAMVGNPQVLLADEPTGNLDSNAGKQIIAMLKNLNQKGKTVILITHDASIARCTDRMIEIQDGRIQADIPNSMPAQTQAS